jgi:hypothetical protein
MNSKTLYLAMSCQNMKFKKPDALYSYVAAS